MIHDKYMYVFGGFGKSDNVIDSLKVKGEVVGVDVPVRLHVLRVGTSSIEFSKSPSRS